MKHTPASLWTALAMVTDSVYFIAAEGGRFLGANEAALAGLGCTREELLRLTLADVFPGASERPMRDELENVSRGDTQQASMSCLERDSGGRERRVQITVRRADTAKETVLVLVARPVVEQPPRGGELSPEAPRDALTGLPTRAHMEACLQRATDALSAGGTPLAVFFLDVDHFKQVNDTWGHAAGDTVLIALAERLVKCLRPSDVVSRYGGDEFVLLLENIGTTEQVMQVAERIRRAIGAPIPWNDDPIEMTVSIGIALGIAPCPAPHALIDAADRAMYRAKRKGRDGRVELHNT